MRSLGTMLIAASSIFFIETAYEMYLLTFMHGRQMLWFSLAHGPGLFLIVLLSGIAFIGLAAFAFVVTVLNLMGKLDLGKGYHLTMYIILLVQVVHATLFLTYDHWAAALFP